MNYKSELRCAIEAVRKASGLCREVQAALVSEETLSKKDKSPVTVADYGAQAVVNLCILGAFPEDRIVGEEDASLLRDHGSAVLRERVVRHAQAVHKTADESDVLAAIDRGNWTGGPAGRHWVLDPIDGTKGFLRGDQYAVALALIEDGEVVLGALGCPNLPVSTDAEDGLRGCLFAAVRGEGATLYALDSDRRAPVHTSRISDATQACFCESVESEHSSHDDAVIIAERLGITQPPYRIDSQCKYAAIARGDASIYLRLPTRKDYREKVWDHAAGWMVVNEAGGKVSDVRGQPLDFSIGRTLDRNQGVVATNGPLHEEVLEAVRAVLGH